MSKEKQNAGTTATGTNILRGCRIYLSGPMDFVASRTAEKRAGWRIRVGKFLHSLGAMVYDPWAKPIVVGQQEIAEGYEYSPKKRAEWTFENSNQGRKKRAELCHLFRPTVHINSRMVDICDLLIAYCPTNIYSVGTVNEIVRARAQHKPVLFVSPPIIYPEFEELSLHLEKKGDIEALTLLQDALRSAAIKANPEGIPSPWYMAIIDQEYFFDGFGFAGYDDLKPESDDAMTSLDQVELIHPPKRPLLPFLEELNKKLPKRYDLHHDDFVENADWLILHPGLYEDADSSED